MIKYLLILLSILFSYVLFGQKKIKLKNAEQLIGSINNQDKREDMFVGNVVFQQGKTMIYCDTAILLKNENIVKAYSNVRITDGDSIRITANRLRYTGNNKKAYLRENVIFNKLNSAVLYTDYLDYDRNIQEAKYFNGGKLVDSTNVLTSRRGYYSINNHLASFKKKVVVTTPDYTLKSDTLQYNTKTNTVYFRNFTEIQDSDSSKVYYERGEYNTNIKKSAFSLGKIQTKSYVIVGNKMMADDISQLYQAIGEVELTYIDNDVIITGDYGIYDKKNDVARVFGNALLKKIMKQDTLYLTADTLFSVETNKKGKEKVLAYNNVKFYKSDLQGKSDSMVYIKTDSVLYFYQDPVLWTESNQMSSDSIRVEINDGIVKTMNMFQRSFVVSIDSIDNYNQIKGREMVAIFEDGKIKKVDVTGNGESLFFALNDEENEMIGMNKIFCSEMTVFFNNNTANKISFYNKPDAKFIPPHELKKNQKVLDGFLWRVKEKPKKEDLLLLDLAEK